MNEPDYAYSACWSFISRFILMAQSITPQTVMALPAMWPVLFVRLWLSITNAADSALIRGMLISYSYPLCCTVCLLGTLRSRGYIVYIWL